MLSALEDKLTSLRRVGSTLRRDASNASIASTHYDPSPAPSPVSKRSRAKRRDEMLNKLPEEYLKDQFDPVLFELQQLPPTFDEQALDNIVDARATVLEVMHCGWNELCLHGSIELHAAEQYRKV